MQALFEEKQGGTTTVDSKITGSKDSGLPAGITDFKGLMASIPLGERTLREAVKSGRIPSIRMPGGRRLLFHLASVERALLRFQRGGISQ